MVFRDSSPGARDFFNVTEAVGYECPNLTDDVKVVQFFLKTIASDFSDYNPPGVMKVDGWFGPTTHRWIVEFQIGARRQGHNYMVDGIVDRAGNANNPDKLRSSISKTFYTIRAINNGMFWRHRDIYENLTTHPSVPDDVKIIFQRIKSGNK